MSSPEQKRRLKRSYQKKREWMDERGLCVWNGEWGPVYARKHIEGEGFESINESRYRVLKDQLGIYNEVQLSPHVLMFLAHTAGQDRLSWSIWLYKDIGFQGMVYISQSTPYFQLFEKFLAKKHRLAVDAWGADDSVVKDVYDPLLKLIVDEIDPKYRNLYPHPVWTLSARVGRLARNILVTEFLVKEWADHFIGHDSEEELEKIAASFKYENCVKREGLNNILTENAK